MTALSPPYHPKCREKRLSCVCPWLQLIPPHQCRDHSQIQPRSLAPVVLGGRGAPAALEVRWAQEGQLSPFLLGVLLVLFLLCCPAKGTRRRQDGRWQWLLPGACKQEAEHPLPNPLWDRTWMLVLMVPCLGALWERALPSSGTLHPTSSPCNVRSGHQRLV